MLYSTAARGDHIAYAPHPPFPSFEQSLRLVGVGWVEMVTISATFLSLGQEGVSFESTSRDCGP